MAPLAWLASAHEIPACQREMRHSRAGRSSLAMDPRSYWARALGPARRSRVACVLRRSVCGGPRPERGTDLRGDRTPGQPAALDTPRRISTAPRVGDRDELRGLTGRPVAGPRERLRGHTG